ncbi:MAG: InlB B-repeat-containing protein, partial [Bacillota bacterium]
MKNIYKITLVLIIISALMLSVVGCGITTDSSDNIASNVVETEENLITSDSSSETVADANSTNSGALNASGDQFYVTFITNSGSAVDQVLTDVITSAPSTTREGYEFTGWHTLEDLSDSAITYPYYISANTVLYASWVSVGVIAVSTVEDLIAIGTDTASMQASYYLTNDIDLAGIDWIPLGLNYEEVYDDDGVIESISLSGEDAPQAFYGTLDGKGYSIYNMTITPFIEEEMASYLPYGLFARFASNSSSVATVTNLSIINYSITLEGGLSKFYLGGLVGLVDDAIITNCTANGTISNPQSVVEPGWEDIFGMGITESERVYAGGLVGVLTYGTITGCNSAGTLSSYSTGDSVYFGD